MRSQFLSAFCIATLLATSAVSTSLADGRFPDEEGLASLWGRAKSETAPPFELPEALPGGGVKMFHRAQSRQSYEYSQGGLVLLYRFDQPDAAAEDFAVFAAANERVDEKTSALLSKQGACISRQKDSATLWVLLDESVVGFQLPLEKWSTPTVAKAAEDIVKVENERTARLFGEPERAVTTFIKAVAKVEEAQIMRSLSSGGAEDIQKRIRLLKNYLPMLRLTMMERMGGMGGNGADPAIPPFRIARAEKTADGRVFVPVKMENVQGELPWRELLLFAAGGQRFAQMGQVNRNAGGDEQLWIPVIQIGSRWAIDVNTLRQSLFTKAVQAVPERDCFGNLRQIVLALKAAANDDVQTQKFPEKLSTLATAGYVDGTKVFIAPGSTTRIDKAGDIDEKTDFIYAGNGQADTGDGDVIIIYDKPAVHDGKGRHVGFADGHLQWIEEKAFQEMISAQRKDTPAPRQ